MVSWFHPQRKPGSPNARLRIAAIRIAKPLLLPADYNGLTVRATLKAAPGKQSQLS